MGISQEVRIVLKLLVHCWLLQLVLKQMLKFGRTYENK